MRSLNLSIDIPKPSRYVPHSRVDEIATEIAGAYREFGDIKTDTLSVESFVESILEKEVLWQPIPEPENRVCFASIDTNRITLNENHRFLFAAKPFLLHSCLSHEIGHEVLGHLELLRKDESQGNLFGDPATSEFVFHDSAWRQFDVTRDEIAKVKNELARMALVDQASQEILKIISDKLEPEWMYYQAEQFASCFLIPKDRLFECLETGLDITKWPTLYNLAAQFGVSISMISVRLQKLKLIEINGKEITLLPQEKQSSLIGV